MRVTLCVDALEPEPGGIGRYSWELCKGLAKREDISQLLFLRGNRLIDDPARLLRGERLRRGRGLVRLYRAYQTSRALRTTVVHGPNYFLPHAAETGVVTVHDLSVFRYPDTHPAARVRAFERLFTDSVTRAAHIITDSETVRNELLEAFALQPENVTAVALGVDPRFRPHESTELTPPLSKWSLTAGGYALCVSTLEPRKKIVELLAAWRCLPSRLRDRWPLVLAGGGGWRNRDLHDQIQEAVREGWLRSLGFVDETHLPQLYAGAALFIYPSIYEGFGLPPLEAMASGIPVLVSGGSCLPEVCGGAARFVDPDDIPGFSAEISAALEDSDWRHTATQQGLVRAHHFTWDRCVSQTINIYRDIWTETGLI